MAIAIARFRGLARDESGQDVIEYALLASLIVIVAIAAVGDFGGQAGRLWNGIESVITALPLPGPSSP